MQPAEIDIGGHRARLHYGQQQFARRLNDDARKQWRKRLVAGRYPPAVLIGSRLGVGKGFYGGLPGPGGDAGIGS